MVTTLAPEPGEMLGARLADARRAAGDQNDFVFERAHVLIPSGGIPT